MQGRVKASCKYICWCWLQSQEWEQHSQAVTPWLLPHYQQNTRGPDGIQISRSSRIKADHLNTIVRAVKTLSALSPAIFHNSELLTHVCRGLASCSTCWAHCEPKFGQSIPGLPDILRIRNRSVIFIFDKIPFYDPIWGVFLPGQIPHDRRIY